MNVVRRAGEVLKGQNIYLAMGGFHLAAASRRKVRKITERFRDEK